MGNPRHWFDSLFFKNKGNKKLKRKRKPIQAKQNLL